MTEETEVAESVLDQEEMMDFATVDMSDVEDLPDFITPPNGNYACAVPSARIDVIKPKEGNPFQAIKFTYQITAVLSTEGEAQPQVGALFEEIFMPKTKDDFSMKLLKKRLKSLLPDDMDPKTPLPDQLAFIEQTYKTDAATNVVTKQTKSKPNDKGVVYDNLNISQTYPLDEVYALPEDVPFYQYVAREA